MAAPCLFCGIVAGTTPAAVVHRQDGVTAFLDIRPLFKGHVLVVPDRHADTLVDLPPESIPPLFAAVQQTALAVERALSAHGTFIAINNRVSQSVPHLHVHVVPRTKGDKLRGFFWPRQAYADPAEMESIRAAIAAAIER
jgi:histidine triad (HIT) family protein